MSSRDNGTRKPNTNKSVVNKSTVKKVNVGNKVKKPSIPINLRHIQTKGDEIIYYVPDTNVILDDWSAIFKFEEHNVVIVSQVWKELDKHKKGRSDEAMNSRRAIKAIDNLILGKTIDELTAGVILTPPENLTNGKLHMGRLFLVFSKPTLPTDVDIELSLDDPDDRIIMICLKLKSEGKHVVLISNDGNCRVRATKAGIEAEQFLNEASTNIIGEEDIHTGFHYMPDDFWHKQTNDLRPVPSGSTFVYTLTHKLFKKVNCNEFIIFNDGMKLQVTKKIDDKTVEAETFTNFHHHKISNIAPRNIEQELALQLLTDERVRAVSLAGMAGSGKTFLAIAAALHLCYDLRLYDRIILTRPTVGSEEDIGFLPGSEEEKMTPWMGALTDNLEILLSQKNIHGNEPGTTNDRYQELSASIALMSRRIKICSLNFMKGRTFNRTLIIVDEGQDIPRKTLKTICTRTAEDSKLIILGNVGQIDNSFLSEYTCGMSIFIQTFTDDDVVGHITLQKGERGRFATLAEEKL